MKVTCKIVDFLGIALVFISAIFLSSSLYAAYPKYAAPHDWYHVTHERFLDFFADQGFNIAQMWAAYENNSVRSIEIQKSIERVFKNIEKSLDYEDSKKNSLPEFLEKALKAQPIVFNEKTNSDIQKDFPELIITRKWPLQSPKEHYFFLENALKSCFLKFLKLKNKNGQMPSFDLVFANFEDEFENNKVMTGYLRAQRLEAHLSFKMLEPVDDESNNEQEFEHQEGDEEDDIGSDKSTNFLTRGSCVVLSITSGFIILVLAAGAEYLMYEL